METNSFHDTEFLPNFLLMSNTKFPTGTCHYKRGRISFDETFKEIWCAPVKFSDERMLELALCFLLEFPIINT